MCRGHASALQQLLRLEGLDGQCSGDAESAPFLNPLRLGRQVIKKPRPSKGHGLFIPFSVQQGFIGVCKPAWLKVDGKVEIQIARLTGHDSISPKAALIVGFVQDIIEINTRCYAG